MDSVTTGEDRLALAKRLWDWEPHEGQRQFLTLTLPDGSEPKTLVAACGRRWGKTEGLSVDVVIRLLTEPDLAQLLVGPTKDQADGLFDAVDEKLQEVRGDATLLEEFPHVADFVIKRSPYAHIRRKSDGQMILSSRSAGQNGRNLRGKGTTRKMKRFRVVVDEAAYVPDPAINEAIRPMLATVPGGGQLVMISSPNGRRGPFYDAFVKGERADGRARSVRLPSCQNPLVDPDFLAEMRDEMTDRQYRAEFLAEFVDAAGQVFPDADIDGSICEEYGSSPLWGCTYVAGVDFGRRADWSVVSVGEVSSSGVRLVQQARFQGQGWKSQVETICSIVKQWGVRYLSCDATGVGDALAENLMVEIAARRLPCELDAFHFTGSSKPILIDALAVALATRRCTFPAIPILLSELRNFEAIPSTNGGRERMAAARGHDDTVCSLALLVRAATPWLVQAANRAQGSGFIVSSGGPRRNREGLYPGKGRDLEWSATSRGSALPFWSDSVAVSLHWWGWRLRSRLLRIVYRFALARAVGAFMRRISNG